VKDWYDTIWIVVWAALYALALAMLLFFTSAANAAILATSATEDGGEIVLTDVPCQLKGNQNDALHHMYTYGYKYVLWGCWSAVKGKIGVIYSNGLVREYEPRLFRFEDVKKEMM
jgi:hypothetical protein